MLFISPSRDKVVKCKTNGKCAICGSDDKVASTPFIPQWTRVDYANRDNLIPMCEKCSKHYYGRFIDLNDLRNIPIIYVELLMRFYRSWFKYLYKYVLMFGDVRNISSQTTDEIITIINNYNKYIRKNKESIDWENL